MSASWGHALRPMTAEEIETADRLGFRCSAAKCTKRRTWRGSYQYVTGRAGRTSEAVRQMCSDHAARFAEKYELTFPDTDAEAGERL